MQESVLPSCIRKGVGKGEKLFFPRKRQGEKRPAGKFVKKNTEGPTDQKRVVCLTIFI